MAKIAVIGGSKSDLLRDELVEKITRELIVRGHQVYHGGIDSGTMRACNKGGGTAIVYDDLAELYYDDMKDKDVVRRAIILNLHSSVFAQLRAFENANLGPAIRRQMLVSECHLVICFDGKIGTFDELVGAIRAKKKIVLVGNHWMPFLNFMAGTLQIDLALFRQIGIGWPVEKIMQTIEAHLG